MRLKFSTILIFVISLVVIPKAYSQASAEELKIEAIEKAKKGWWAESMKTHDERIAWWNEARFGMFVHWGVYSVPAGVWKGKGIGRSYSEHLMRIMKIPLEEYKEKLATTFNPVDFNADTWIKLAKDAGMKYFIITAKHHDGFAMYDSEVSDFNIVDLSAFHRDPMIELKEACKKYGIKFGFYYSHAFDWEHPNAPGNDWDYENPGGDNHLFGGRNYFEPHPELMPRMAKYVQEKSIPQIKELLIKYEPDIIWFDTPHKLAFFENLGILEELRKIAPDVVVNGRLAHGFGDYANTADKPLELYPTKEKYWEAIPTTNESYGYNKVDDSHKPASHFIQLLAKTASRGGNLLMNIGPMGNGQIDQKDSNILVGIGDWLALYGESIYGTNKTTLPLQTWGVTTQKNNELYLHVFNWPEDNKLVIGGLKSAFGKVSILNGKKESKLSTKRLNSEDVEISLPKNAPNTINSILVVKLKEPIDAGDSRLLSADKKNQLLAFDAELQGGNLKYSGGSANSYYVHNWTKENQKLNWNIRLNESAKFNVSIKYETSQESGGSYKISLNNQTLKGSVEPSKKKKEIVNVKLGQLQLKEGIQNLTISPEKITGKQLMKIFEINLIPVE